MVCDDDDDDAGAGGCERFVWVGHSIIKYYLYSGAMGVLGNSSVVGREVGRYMACDGKEMTRVCCPIGWSIRGRFVGCGAENFCLGSLRPVSSYLYVHINNQMPRYTPESSQCKSSNISIS